MGIERWFRSTLAEGVTLGIQCSEHMGFDVEAPRPLPIPTLLLSGALDPVTPSSYAEDARAFLPQSRHVVIAESHHGPFSLEGAWQCIHRVWADFLDRGSVERLETSCLEKLPGPPFAVDGDRSEA